jgi:hypothetical protein
MYALAIEDEINLPWNSRLCFLIPKKEKYAKIKLPSA